MVQTSRSLPCNPESLKLATMAFEGNIVPLSWLHHIRFDSGQPDLNAIMLLADIVYWYRPVQVRHEASGTFIGYRQKFQQDWLRKSYQSYADLFGLTKRQVTDAIIRLEKLGLIQRVFRTVQTEVATCNNILFIALHADEVIRITTSNRSHNARNLEPSSTATTTAPSPCLDNSASLSPTIPPLTDSSVRFDLATPAPIEGEVSSTNGTGLPLQRDTIIDKEITAKTSSFSPQAVVEHQEQPLSKPLMVRERVHTLVEIWNTTLNDPAVTAIAVHHPRLHSLFLNTFDSSLAQWQAFCTRVATTPFLRGHGPNGWKADLKWCLSPLNLLGILQGRYDRCVGYTAAVPVSTTMADDEQHKQAELLAHINAITDLETRQFQHALLTSVATFQHYNWLKDLRIDCIQGSTVIVSAPSKFIRDRCQQQYEAKILAVFTPFYPHVQKVDVIVQAQSHPPPAWQVEEAVVLTDMASSMPNPQQEGRAS